VRAVAARAADVNQTPTLPQPEGNIMTNTAVGNWYLARMTMRGLGALIGGLLAVSFGHLHIAPAAQTAAAVVFGMVGGVAGHWLGHFTANPDGEIPAVDVLLRVAAWAALVAAAALITVRWPAVGLAVWLMLTQSSLPGLAKVLAPLWRRLRMEHVAPAPATPRPSGVVPAVGVAR
jgi:hypothetical protein